jgi:hypothetical protein
MMIMLFTEGVWLRESSHESAVWLGDLESSLTQACVCVQQFLAPRAEMARTLLLTLSALVVLSSAHATPKTDMPRGMDAVAKFFSGANHTRLERLAGKKIPIFCFCKNK